jgi:hypothetical protein
VIANVAPHIAAAAANADKESMRIMNVPFREIPKRACSHLRAPDAMLEVLSESVQGWKQSK